jgi:hypothetical protein
MDSPRNYHEDMVRLWLSEFQWEQTQPKGFKRTLRHISRKRATRSAAIMRLSRAVYESTLKESSVRAGKSDGLGGRVSLYARTDTPMDINQNISTEAKTPASEVRVPTNRIELYEPQHMTLREDQQLASILTDELGYGSGAILTNYPWEDSPEFSLQPRGSRPFYLWDRKKGRTVKAEDLPEDVQYTAISHTWGRWRKPTPPITVPGVDEWKIPENSKFEVKYLPKLLAQVHCSHKFLAIPITFGWISSVSHKRKQP